MLLDCSCHSMQFMANVPKTQTEIIGLRISDKIQMIGSLVDDCDIMLERTQLDNLDDSLYLGSMTLKPGKAQRVISSRIGKDCSVFCPLQRVW